MPKQDYTPKTPGTRLVQVKPKPSAAPLKALSLPNIFSAPSSGTPKSTARGAHEKADAEHLATGDVTVTFVSNASAIQSPKHAIQSPRVPTPMPTPAQTTVFDNTLRERLRSLQQNQDTALQRQMKQFDKKKVPVASANLKPPPINSPKPAFASQKKEKPPANTKLHPKAATAGKTDTVVTSELPTKPIAVASSSTGSPGLINRMLKAAAKHDIDHLPPHLAVTTNPREELNKARKARLIRAGQLSMGAIPSPAAAGFPKPVEDVVLNLVIEDPDIPELITGSGKSLPTPLGSSGGNVFGF